MSIWKWLGGGSDDAGGSGARDESDIVRKIVDRLNDLPVERARYVAMFAFLLSRAANADLSISDDETREMERIVAEDGGLPEEQAVIVVQMAKTQNLLFGGTDNFRVAKEFRAIADHEQKIGLIRCLFAVSAADDSISTVESTVIRQIADEIGLEHAEFADVRSEFRDQLAVLKTKKPEEG